MSNVEFENSYWKKHNQLLEERHKLVLELLKDLKFHSLIDIACGSGLLLSYIDCEEKFGIDISQVALKKAKRIGIVKQCDIEKEKCPFKQKFDVITLTDVLEHTTTPDLLFKNICHNGNIVIVTVPNFSFIGCRLKSLLGMIPRIWDEKHGHCFFYNYEKLDEVLRRNGFLIQVNKHYFPLMRNRIFRIFSMMIGLVFPNFWATEFCVIAQKQPHDNFVEDMMGGEQIK